MKPPTTTREIPRWFSEELRALDPKLAVKWSERSQRWQVMRERESEEAPSGLVKKDISEREWWRYVPVWRVENADGTYRDLDMRLIHAMRHGDTHNRDWREVVAEMEKRESEEAKARSGDLPEIRREAAEKLYDGVTEKIFVGSGGTAIQAARRGS